MPTSTTTERLSTRGARREARPVKVRRAEVSAAELRAAEVRAPEVRLAEVRPAMKLTLERRPWLRGRHHEGRTRPRVLSRWGANAPR
jgi:hypothetical protein